MQATGIIAEYNPFHNGHLYHIQEAKRLTQQPVVVAMSASFMQRGEPAILSKWQRAALAVRCGADLVLELPCAFTLRSAEHFAYGGVSLLAATGCVNTLCCGAENAATDFLALARIACSADAQSELQALLSQGTGYAAAWEKIFAAHANTLVKPLNAPNDILALCYAKAIVSNGAHLKPLYVERRDAGYDDSLLWQLICYRLRLLSPAQLKERTECSEGLENRLKQAADCASLSEAVAAISNKRYTTSRCRRLLLQLLLDAPRASWQQHSAAYLRVLAFNDTGRELLRQMKSTASLPVITKLGRGWQYDAKLSSNAKEQLALEMKATDSWSLLQKQPQLNRQGNDFYFSPAYIK